MKFRNISILSILLLFCFFAGAINTYAMNTGFTTEEVSDEIKKTV